jgi:fatty-acyl-CoA synthase
MEGRVGVAAIVAKEGFRLETLKTYMKAHLPPYARPLFVRLCDTIPSTTTFKLQQDELAHTGLTAHAKTDRLWFNEPSTDRVVRCDEHLLHVIASGVLPL